MPIRAQVRRLLRRSGVTVSRFPASDFDAEFVELFRSVRDYTMTSPERVFALRDAARYVSRAQVPGAVVECGVWRGGSMMAVARTLLDAGDSTRDLHLFDTFSGMVEPGAEDRRGRDQRSARDLLARADRGDPESVWCVATVGEVRTSLSRVGYPMERIHLVEGKVEDTIPEHAPERIALLRLDTDWYESTRHELVHLFERISPGGVLILDDYGYWQGARRAVDEYLAEHGHTLLLNRIDDTGRIALIPG